MLQCPGCNRDLPDEAVACWACGHRIVSSAEPPPGAETLQPANADPIRNCTSCAAVVPVEALKCPACGEWREDIKRERNLCYLWSFIACVPLIAFIYGTQAGWWRPRPSVRYLGEQFDFGTFLSSGSGLILLLAFVGALAVSVAYYAAVSRKTGNWVWL